MKVSYLRKKVKEILSDLALQVKEEREKMTDFLKFCARFHSYSPLNQLLIWSYKPDATFVAGFKKWQKMGRKIKKGEHGIPIFAPIKIKVEKQETQQELEGWEDVQSDENDEQEKEIIKYRVVYVWDVSQTEGKPLPETPDTLSGTGDKELKRYLEKLCSSLGIETQYSELTGTKKGISTMGNIVVDSDLDDASQSAVLLHEIAHELMHNKYDRLNLDRKTLEIEAEAVAYTVLTALGYPAKATYLALYDAKPEDFQSSMERILKTSGAIIRSIQDLNKEKERRFNHDKS